MSCLKHCIWVQVESPKKKKGGALSGVASPLKQDGKERAHSTKKRGGQKETREVWVFPTRTLEEVKKRMAAEDLSQEVERQLGVEGSSQHTDSLPELVDGAPSLEVNVCVHVCVCVRVRVCVHVCACTCIFWE